MTSHDNDFKVKLSQCPCPFMMQPYSYMPSTTIQIRKSLIFTFCIYKIQNNYLYCIKYIRFSQIVEANSATHHHGYTPHSGYSHGGDII